MKIILSVSSCLILLISLAGCTLSPDTDSPSQTTVNQVPYAREALIEFFRRLHEGDYQGASELYSGSYEWLREVSPTIPPDDLAQLLAQGCQYNGLVCLEALSAEAILMFRSDSYLFRVKFQQEDGSLFSLGPCCGEDETSPPSFSSFDFRVERGEDGVWRVNDLPPILP
jgi:hypothetical protein